MRHHNSREWDLAEAKLRKRHDSSKAMVEQRYALGVSHCVEGIPPTNQNADYLEGYGNQYAYEQSASAQSGDK